MFSCQTSNNLMCKPFRQLQLCKYYSFCILYYMTLHYLIFSKKKLQVVQFSLGFILVKCVLHFMSRLILKTHMAYELCYFPKRTNIHLLLIWTGTTTRFFFKKNSNFAECRPEGTRQRIFKKIKFKLCRVLARGHSAKIFF